MNKAILMPIQPQWIAKILNGEKTIEIRKKFPKDYVGWMYIYCTKAKPYLIPKSESNKAFWEEKVIDIDTALNGKVVARFWCDKVELIKCGWRYEDCCNHYDTNEMNEKELLKYSCLSICELIDYLGYNGKTISNIVGYAIHISKLEVFERPKELKEFDIKIRDNVYRRRKAPQSWCYIEGE